MGAQPTVSDVAVAAGVSRQTVSNVLNSPGIVRPETRERVEAAIRSLGYRPHASARRLRTQKSSTIGIRLDPLTRDGISGSVLDRFLHALTEQADALGLRVLLFTARDPEDEIEQFRRLSEAADVDAFVLTSTFHGDPRTEWLIEHGQSFVTFGRPWGIDDMADPEHLWVDVDGRAGLRAATEHLLATGRERIGFLGWPAGSGTGDDRRAGWLEAMRSACQKFGERPAGVESFRSHFAIPIGGEPSWMIVQADSVGLDDQGRPGATAFHALFVGAWSYRRAGADPLAFAPAFRSDWTLDDHQRPLPQGSFRPASRRKAPSSSLDPRVGPIVEALTKAGTPSRSRN